MTGALFVPLKRQPFEAFAAGTKRWEIRRLEGQWAKAATGMPARLRLGYSGHGEIRRVVGQVISSPYPGQLLMTLPFWQEAIPWGQSLEHAAQSLRVMLLSGPHRGKHLVAIEMLEP